MIYRMNPTRKETPEVVCLLCAKERFEIPAVGCRPDTVAGINEKTAENENEGDLQMSNWFSAQGGSWARQPNNSLCRASALSVP